MLLRVSGWSGPAVRRARGLHRGRPADRSSGRPDCERDV